MRKSFIFLALILMAQISFAASVTKPADIPVYWSSVNGKAGENLFNQLSTATAKGFSSLGYSGLWSAYASTDVYPADSVSRAGEIWDMYSACHFAVSQHGSYSGECDRFNREHTIPQSWWGGGTSNQGCDIFHVLPTDGAVNGWRSNDPYGEVSSATKTSTNGCKSGPSKLSGYSGTVFEPIDQYKGDIARGLLGTLVKWKGNWTQDHGSSTFNGTFTEAGHFGLTAYGLEVLIRWHRQDPVSQKEIDRNNGIQATQGNRNPFIDYPYLAEFIWGEHAGETVDMTMLMPSTDPEFVPGVSNGWRGGVGPIPTVKYGVNWYVNGVLDHTDSIAENARLSELPAEPVSCSSESNTFMGWTDAPIEKVSDEAPATLLKVAADFPVVTEDVNYYSVFAKAETGDVSLPTTYTFDAEHQEGWTNTATDKGSYWLLESGKTIVSPEVDLMYLNSIVVQMRTFGGTTYNQLTVSEEDGVLTTIEATKGSTMTEYTWTNNLYIAGTSALTFSSDYGANKGIGIQSIVINAGGTSTTYSRYITSCQDPSEMETVLEQGTARKVMIGSQIMLLVGDQLFTITGQRIR